jgi:hypothetical protein
MIPDDQLRRRASGDLPKVRWTLDRRNPRAQHAEQVADVAASVADAVKSAAAGGQPDAVLVIGGDCTIEVGVVSGFTRPSERVGLIYLCMCSRSRGRLGAQVVISVAGWVVAGSKGGRDAGAAVGL